MITRKKLLSSKEYWVELLQNKLYMEVHNYLEKPENNQTQLAEKLGVSKSYISQILNGNFDHRMSKFVEILLALGKVPLFTFKSIESYIDDDKLGINRRDKLVYKPQEYTIYMSGYMSGIAESIRFGENEWKKSYYESRGSTSQATYSYAKVSFS